jgi:hypothetical protein
MGKRPRRQGRAHHRRPLLRRQPRLRGRPHHPEAAVGGPIALVIKNGDPITIDAGCNHCCPAAWSGCWHCFLLPHCWPRWVLFALSIYQQQRYINQQNAVAQASLIVRNLGTVVAQDVLASDRKGIRSLMASTAIFPEVRELVVTDWNGEVLVALAHTPDSDPLEVENPKALDPPKGQSKGQFYRTNANDTTEVWQPIDNNGWVYIVYDYSAQSRDQLRVLVKSLVSGIILAMIASLLFFFVLRRPVHDLQQLIRFAKELDVYRGSRQIHITSHLDESAT